MLSARSLPGHPLPVLVCDNETNNVALFGSASNPTAFTKDGVQNTVVHGDASATHADGVGTKAAFWYHFDHVAPGETVRVELRLDRDAPTEQTFGAGFDSVVADRRREADAFYAHVIPAETSDDDRLIARRAFAGLLWGKQLYRYTVRDWLDGDPAQPAAPPQRHAAERRNVGWAHLALADVISMPDEWEYPWFAAWDLAFHCVGLAYVDPAFAKSQLVLMCREWAMHPDGQIPAYEWAFGDVNPPVHAWAAWHVYQVDGARDQDFLIRVFTKLLLNFSSWVNREDADGSNLFEGGFLGMDNIGLFDRSTSLGPGFRLEESDATSWMAFYCLTMLQISLELARHDQVWDDLATKFLEHFLAIAEAVNNFGSDGIELWDDEDGFCYDVLTHPDGTAERLKVRSMVGLLPILPATVIEPWVSDELPDFTARLRWLSKRRPDLMNSVLTSADAAGHASAAVPARPRPSDPRAAPDVRPGRVPLTARHPVAVRGVPRALFDDDRRPGTDHRLRARRVPDRAVRRQLQLARTHLDAGERPAQRGPAQLRRLRAVGDGGGAHRQRPDRSRSPPRPTSWTTA